MHSSFEWSNWSSTAKTHVLLIRAHKDVNKYFIKTWILKYSITLIILDLRTEYNRKI